MPLHEPGQAPETVEMRKYSDGQYTSVQKLPFEVQFYLGMTPDRAQKPPKFKTAANVPEEIRYWKHPSLKETT
jgi:hypothetical protein